jgi:hypothetical protein
MDPEQQIALLKIKGVYAWSYDWDHKIHIWLDARDDKTEEIVRHTLDDGIETVIVFHYGEWHLVK